MAKQAKRSGYAPHISYAPEDQQSYLGPTVADMGQLAPRALRPRAIEEQQQRNVAARTGGPRHIVKPGGHVGSPVVRHGAGPVPAPAAPQLAAGGGAAPAGGANIQLTGAEDPRLARHAAAVEGRLGDWDKITGQMVERTAAKRRALTAGQRAEAAEAARVRGALPGETESALLGKESSDIAGMMTDVGLAREGAKDAYLLGSTGAMAAPGESARASQALNLQASGLSIREAESRMQADLARERMKLDTQLANMSMQRQKVTDFMASLNSLAALGAMV